MSFRSIVVLALLTFVGLSGCGKEDAPAKVAATQVVAKVNGTEITVHQLNFVLGRARNVSPDSSPEAKRRVLERLIQEELAKQAAVKDKLDRSPGVLQAMELSKIEVLARAHIGSVTRKLPRPTDEEVKQYYEAHPELFAQRRGYMLEELSVAKKDGLAKSLEEQIEKKLSMQDIASWLKAEGIEYRGRRGVRTAEQLPLKTLPAIHAMKDKEIKVIEDERGAILVLHLVTSRAAPIDEKAAAQRIRQFLFNRRASEAVANELKQLREQAKIEYLGEFAEGASGEALRAKAKADAEAKAQAAAKAKADQEARERAEAATKARREAEAEARKAAEAKERAAARETTKLKQQSIERGVSGLTK